MEKTLTQKPSTKGEAKRNSSLDKIREGEKSRANGNTQLYSPSHGSNPTDNGFSSNQFLHLQRTIGNRAVGRLIQAKLTVGRPDDEYEREADQVADTVMRMTAPRPPEDEENTVQTKPVFPTITPFVQRAQEEEEEPLQMKLAIQRQTEEVEEEEPLQTKLAVQRQAEEPEEEEQQTKPIIQRDHLEEEEERVQTKPASIQRLCPECEEESQQQPEEEETAQTKPAGIQRLCPECEKKMQRKTEPGVEKEETAQAKHDNSIQRKADGLSANIKSPGAGAPLSPTVRARIEPVLGVDLGQVRVHSDAKAHESARALQAKAFTNRNNIWLGHGQSAEDTALMAHEATHVVQQDGIIRRQPLINNEHEDRNEKTREAIRAGTSASKHDESMRFSPPATSTIPSSLGITPEKRRSAIIPATEATAPTLPGAARVTKPVPPASPESRLTRAAPPRAPNEAPPATTPTELPSVPTRASEVAVEAKATTETSPGVETEARHPTAQPPTGEPVAAVSEGAPLEEAPPEAQGAVDTAKEQPVLQAEETKAASEESVVSVKNQASESQEVGISQAENVMVETAAEPIPSLSDLLEPVEEEPQEEFTQMAANGLGEASPETEFEAEPMPAIMRMSDTGQTVMPGREQQEEYDPDAARAQVQSIVARFTVASADSQARVQTQAEETKGALTAKADALRQQIQAQVAANVASLRAAFAAERALLQASVEAARAQVATTLEGSRAEAHARGEDAKANITDIFTEHRTNVENTVEDNVAAVEEMRTHYAGYAHQRTQEQAGEARQRGRAKAATYPGTERGRVQANAAQDVANETAQEMDDREPETIEAIEELVVDIPDQFREQGEEALNGFDEGLPDLLNGVDEQVQSVSDALNEQANQVYQQLNTLDSQMQSQLDAAESAVIAQAEAMGQQAQTQIDSGLETAVTLIDASIPQANQQLAQIVDQAIQILLDNEAPDIETSNEFAQQILAFVNAATNEAVSAQQQAGEKLEEEFDKVDTATNEGLQNIELQASDDLLTLSDSINSTLSEIVIGVEDNFGQMLDQLDEAFIETESQITENLSQAIEQLQGDFSQTLQDTEGEIVNAVDEGLAKNDEALGELDAQMQEAAEDAAWDYDHPILSTLADIGAIVAGVIVGILAVIALVIVAIVAFKVIIAGLVALGVSLAVAKIIVAVIGLGLLAYGIYSAYQARIQAGEGGGFGTFLGALADISGITDIKRAFTEEGLSPFERGFAFGRGIGTLATFFIGRRLNQRINAKLPRSITNPTRGSALRWLRGRFGRGPARPDRGLAGRGYRPAPGERTMTREQWRAQSRAERMARRPGLETRGRRPAPGERATTREQWRAQERARRLGERLHRDPEGLAHGRSRALQQALPPNQRGRVTMSAGVVEDANGVRRVVVATSEPRGYLRPGVGSALQPNEIVVGGTGHAEENIVNWARANGYRVISVGAGRSHCPRCVTAVTGAGATTASPRRVQ